MNPVALDTWWSTCEHVRRPVLEFYRTPVELVVEYPSKGENFQWFLLNLHTVTYLERTG